MIEDLEGEEWRDVINFEGVYVVSNLGRIKSLDRYVKNNVKGRKNEYTFKKSTCLICSVNADGYLGVHLCKDGNNKFYSLQRLVAIHFVSNPENKPEVNHIDGNKQNNIPSNLEWVTHQENVTHSWETGLCDEKLRKLTGGNNSRAKKVYQLTLDGELMKEYDSVSDAARAINGTVINIAYCALGVKNYKTRYGFKWSYILPAA